MPEATSQANGLPERLEATKQPDSVAVVSKPSRKIGRITVSDEAQQFPPYQLLLKDLDAEIERMTDLSDGTGYAQWLLERLWEARQRHGHILDGKQKAKGKQEGRETILYDLKHAAAWTYCFISEQWKLASGHRYPPLRVAEADFEKKLDAWKGYTKSRQITLLTAYLVERAYGKRRRQQGLENPIDRDTPHTPDSYYRIYILPHLSWVKKRLQRNPRLFDFAGPKRSIRAPSNAYLRTIFPSLH